MADDAAPRPLLFDADAYERMALAGAFGGRRVELRDGLIVEMSPVHLQHSRVRRFLMQRLEPTLAVMNAGLRVGDEVSIRFPMFYPTPDVVVHVSTAETGAIAGQDARLVIEVSDSTLADDLGAKLRSYEAVGIPECWVVALEPRVLHRFSHAAGGFQAAPAIGFDAPWESLKIPGLAIGGPG